MKEHFKEQLKSGNAITEETLSKLKGKSLYSEYQVGDRVLWFMLQKITLQETTPLENPEVKLSMISIVERELDQLAEEYEFVDLKHSIPILEKRGKL